jgi:hypothetical protein
MSNKLVQQRKHNVSVTLVPEIWHHLLSYLEPSSALRLSRTSIRMYCIICNAQKFWKLWYDAFYPACEAERLCLASLRTRIIYIAKAENSKSRIPRLDHLTGKPLWMRLFSLRGLVEQNLYTNRSVERSCLLPIPRDADGDWKYNGCTPHEFLITQKDSQIYTVPIEDATIVRQPYLARENRDAEKRLDGFLSLNANYSLRKYVEENISRQLVRLETGHDEPSSSNTGECVVKAISGRWAVVGHLVNVGTNKYCMHRMVLDLRGRVPAAPLPILDQFSNAKVFDTQFIDQSGSHTTLGWLDPVFDHTCILEADDDHLVLFTAKVIASELSWVLTKLERRSNYTTDGTTQKVWHTIVLRRGSLNLPYDIADEYYVDYLKHKLELGSMGMGYVYVCISRNKRREMYILVLDTNCATIETNALDGFQPDNDQSQDHFSFAGGWLIYGQLSIIGSLAHRRCLAVMHSIEQDGTKDNIVQLRDYSDGELRHNHHITSFFDGKHILGDLFLLQTSFSEYVLLDVYKGERIQTFSHEAQDTVNDIFQASPVYYVRKWEHVKKSARSIEGWRDVLGALKPAKKPFVKVTWADFLPDMIA